MRPHSLRGWLALVTMALVATACATDEPAGDDDAAAGLDELRLRVASAAAPWRGSDSDLEVRLSGPMLAGWLAELGDDPSARELRFRSTRKSGYLERRRRRGFDLGWYVELDGDRDLTAIARIGSVAARWSPVGRVEVEVPLDVAIDARLHWHVEPPIGGGFGDRLDVTGTTTATVGLTADVETIEDRFGYVIELLGPSELPFRIEATISGIGRVGLSQSFDLPLGRLNAGPLPELLAHEGKIEIGAPLRLEKSYRLTLSPQNLVHDGGGVVLHFDVAVDFSESGPR